MAQCWRRDQGVENDLKMTKSLGELTSFFFWNLKDIPFIYGNFMKFQLNDSICLHMLFTDVVTFKTGLGFPGLSRVLQGRMNIFVFHGEICTQICWSPGKIDRCTTKKHVMQQQISMEKTTTTVGC